MYSVPVAYKLMISFSEPSYSKINKFTEESLSESKCLLF